MCFFIVYISIVWGGLAHNISLIRLWTIIFVSGLFLGALFFKFIKFVSLSIYSYLYTSFYEDAALMIFSYISGLCSLILPIIVVSITQRDPTLDSQIMLAPYYDPSINSEQPKLLPVSIFASFILKSRFTPRLPTKFYVNRLVVVVFYTSKWRSKSFFYFWM